MILGVFLGMAAVCFGFVTVFISDDDVQTIWRSTVSHPKLVFYKRTARLIYVAAVACTLIQVGCFVAFMAHTMPDWLYQGWKIASVATFVPFLLALIIRMEWRAFIRKA